MNIVSDILILVEGKDEVNLLDALGNHCLSTHQCGKIQIIDAGGKYKFPNNLRAIWTAAQTRPSLRAIGVIRDADDDAQGAFTSVCESLQAVGYPTPSAHGSISNAIPAIGVFIVPDGASAGAIETLCRRSQAGDKISGCVEKYVDCLEEHDCLQSPNVDKTFAHAYLAAMRNPVARVGEGARQGVWDFNSEAFADLTEFLQNLVTAA